jgi:hypothetical protein
MGLTNRDVKAPRLPAFATTSRRNEAPTHHRRPRTSAVFPLRKLVLFALLNATDFGLTWYLLRAGGGEVYESNPVAAWWLGHYGWLGLAGFKAATMALAAGLGVLVFVRRPQVGHRLLGFSCAALAAVVLYSAYLCDDLRRRPAGLDSAETARIQDSMEKLDAGLRRAEAFRDVLAAAVKDLRGGRCALEEAVGRLAATEQANDATWMRRFQIYYPGRGDRECLALALVNHIHRETEDSAAGATFRRDIEAQFLALYGRPIPSGVGAGLARRNAGPV